MTEEPPDRERLWEQYKLLVEEYRFQVDLNWRRSQYFFVLNIAVLVAGIGLLSRPSPGPAGLIAAVFGLGALLAVLSMLANDTQHRYYRRARDRMQHAGELAGMASVSISTTPGMAGVGSRGRESPPKLGRLGRVQTFLRIMLVALAVIDLAALVAALT